jgi:hypothetical protein
MQPVAPAAPSLIADYRDQHETLTGVSLRIFPYCRLGSMPVVEVIPRPSLRQPALDTS